MMAITDIRPIKTDEDHRAALIEIERLWSFPDDSPENDKLDVLATLVEAYEAKRRPVGQPSPRDMLEYAVTDMGYSQKELADLLGSRSQASDLLSGRRRISLEVARKISEPGRIPIQLLVARYPELAKKAKVAGKDMQAIWTKHGS
jgi:antitoxin component HigA of HigAB toxin-antitoxin module